MPNIINNFQAEFPVGRVQWDNIQELNFIIGANGSGKTLLLNAIAEQLQKNKVPHLYIPSIFCRTFGYTDKAVKKLVELTGSLSEEQRFCRKEHYGDGEVVLLSMISALLENKKAKVVIIDEIAAKLHPYWQEDLVKWVTQLCPDAQIFVSTHSPMIFMHGYHPFVVHMEKIVSR